MSTIFRQLFDPATSTYTYVVGDAQTKEVAIIDSVREQFSTYVELIEKEQWKVRYLVETHVHADHVTANNQLKNKFPNTEIVLHEKSNVICEVKKVKDGEVLKVGQKQLEFLYTPGHTSESMSVLFNKDRVLTGDTLLIGSCGRTDFQAGDNAAMFRSLKRLAALPPDTLVFPGHDYNGRTVSTIAEERATNKQMKHENLEAFAADLDSWKLPPPKRLAESVPANQRCGNDA